MDKVYVIYYKGQMYKDNGRKYAYLEEKYARQVISSESKMIAQNEFDYFYNMSDEEWKECIDEVKQRFEIREFVEKQNTNDNDPEISSSQALRNLLEKLPIVSHKELELYLKNDDGTWKDLTEVLKIYAEQFNKFS